MTGLHVSFLGVDGIGKSTLSRALCELLRARGLTVREVSWRSTVDAELPRWPGVALQQLWVETFRLLHAGGPVAIPRDFPSWRDGGVEDSVGVGVRQAGPLAACFAELAGNVVLAAEVIRPAMERGEIVVQETFPFKHVLKELMITRSLGGGLSPLAERTLEFIESVFGAPPFRPDVGVLVDGPVELAYRWRMAQAGRLGITESVDGGVAGFRALQEETATVFRRVAKDWDWLVHEVDDGGLEACVARGLAVISAHPRLAELLEG